jgi:hypothetical protein
MVCRNKALKGPFSSGGMPIIGALIHDFDRQSVTWLAAIQQAGIFVFHLISPVTNGTTSSSSAAGWRRSRLSFGDRVIWTRASGRSSGVFQVVKTAQSRGRTERTLLTALSQLLWPDKGREVWFSLGENHEKACRFGLHQLRKCLRGDSCSPQAPSRSAGTLRKDFNQSLLMSHYRWRSPSHHFDKC